MPTISSASTGNRDASRCLIRGSGSDIGSRIPRSLQHATATTWMSPVIVLPYLGSVRRAGTHGARREVMPATDYVEHALARATRVGPIIGAHDVERTALLESGRETQLQIATVTARASAFTAVRRARRSGNSTRRAGWCAKAGRRPRRSIWRRFAALSTHDGEPAFYADPPRWVSTTAKIPAARGGLGME